MIPRFRPIVLLSLLLASPAAHAFPEDLPREVRLDHNLALPDSGGSRLEFQLRIPGERLVFRRDGDEFMAAVRVVCKARRRGDGHEESVLVRASTRSPHFAASRRRGLFLEREFAMPLGPGRWQIEVQIYARGPERPWQRRFDLEVPEARAGSLFLEGPHWPMIGGGDDGEITPPFLFRDPWRQPPERSRFVDGGAGRIPVECALMGWNEEPATIEVILSLEDRTGKLAHYDRRELELGAGRIPLRWQIPVGRFGMGAYLLTVSARSGESERQVRGRLDVGLTPAAFGRNWDRTRELLRPLAGGEEWEELRAAPRDLRLAAWRAFWDRRDPNGALPGNPELEIYCERITESNARFGGGHLPGYLSDRGQVYLEHGPPDRVETYEDTRYFRTLEYWHYGGLGLVYIFEDRHGAGEYTLYKVTNS